MAKKRKASGRPAPAQGVDDTNGGRMGPIKTYEDVADSEDEFHINRDKVMLEDGPDAKRRRKWEEEDALLEPSDEEVLAYSDSEDEVPPRRAGKKVAVDVSDAEESNEEEDEEEGWGTSKKNYYNNDQIETEADALEEEAEAKRLQQKKLQKMSEADFGFDESEWLDDAGNEDNDGDVVTEVLKDIEITPEMGTDERLRILQIRYPELEFLANEFIQLRPLLQELQQEAELESSKVSGGTTPLLVTKSRALAAYIASLTMYFAILTSPAKGSTEQARPLDPAELRDHPVMDSLLQCRQLWSKLKTLKAPTIHHIEEEMPSEEESDTPLTHATSELTLSKKSKKEKARQAEAKKAASLRAKQIADAEESLADLSALIPKSRKSSKKPKSTVEADDESDFGEEEAMDARTAAEKAQKKKSLRFYTSQIAQKANKRADAGRDAGGDNDLPHRERLRDRQARLNAEAEARGKKMDDYGRGGAASALGGDSDSGDDEVAEQIRDEGDEYYDLVAKTSKQKKADKAEKMDAIKRAKAENAMVRVVEGEVDEDGKRAIGYVIEKNKGLAPKRKKDVRNPRVKKRKKYEEKKKKLASTKAVYKGGEERGGYGGEKTGIKPGLVKSIKL